MLIMLYIHTKKSLKKYICFLFCFIFIFGVNFGFVNLPSVSAEGQNEVVKWGANVGDPLEISNVTSTSVEGKVSPSVSMKSVNAYVYPYPSATEEDLIKAINDTTIAAANVVNSVASSLDAIGADWNVKANTARNNARSATTLAAATAAAKDAKDAADAANTAAWRANSGAAAKDAYAAKDAADAARNAANSGAAKDAANAAANAADYAEDAARFEGRGGANDADCDFLNGADFSNAASAAYNAYKVYDIYNSINDNNTTNKAAVDAAFNVVKTAYNYHGFSLPPNALATSSKSLGNINSGEQEFEFTGLKGNKQYILAIDFEDESDNPGYITMAFTTNDYEGFPVAYGNNAAINIDGGVYVSNVVGKSLTWDNTQQSLINNTPTIKFHKNSYGNITTSDVDITNSKDLNVGDIWLRAKNATGSGDSGWVKVWSDQGASAGFIEGALASIKVSAPGSYSFYYYVDSDTGFETNGFYNGIEYDTNAGTGTVPSSAPADNS